LLALSGLTQHYTSFQFSFRRLLVEMARRGHYKEAADQIVRGMMVQLEAMAEGMSALLSHFIYFYHVIFFRRSASQGRVLPGSWPVLALRYLFFHRKLSDALGDLSR
jgi:hypothetical protein